MELNIVNKIEALKIAKVDIKNILLESGIKNGLSADNENAICFFPTKFIKLNLKKTETFILYSVYYINERGVGDKRALSQIVSIALDIYTKREETDTLILDLLEKIENNALKKDYKLEMKNTASLNDMSEFLHLSFDLVKTII